LNCLDAIEKGAGNQQDAAIDQSSIERDKQAACFAACPCRLYKYPLPMTVQQEPNRMNKHRIFSAYFCAILSFMLLQALSAHETTVPETKHPQAESSQAPLPAQTVDALRIALQANSSATYQVADPANGPANGIMQDYHIRITKRVRPGNAFIALARRHPPHNATIGRHYWNGTHGNSFIITRETNATSSGTATGPVYLRLNEHHQARYSCTLPALQLDLLLTYDPTADLLSDVTILNLKPHQAMTDYHRLLSEGPAANATTQDAGRALALTPEPTTTATETRVPPNPATSDSEAEVKVEIAPKPVKLTQPDLRRYYPRRAWTLGITGQSSVKILVNAAGRVIDAKIVASTPKGAFDNAALRAAKTITYEARPKDAPDVWLQEVLVWKRSL
jgi:TonB family protein